MAKSASANRRNDENKINPGIKLTLIVVAILCVVMLVYSVCQSMGVLDRNTTAMTVGEDDISVTQLNQYYHTTRNGFLNQYGSYLSMYGYDLSSAAFDMQNCMFDSTKTWKEYFMEEAVNSAWCKNIYPSVIKYSDIFKKKIQRLKKNKPTELEVQIGILTINDMNGQIKVINDVII